MYYEIVILPYIAFYVTLSFILSEIYNLNITWPKIISAYKHSIAKFKKMVAV